MISNCDEDCLPSYETFLNFLGEKKQVTESKFSSTLDSDDPFDIIYTSWRDLDLVFLVSTLLPYDTCDLEQVLFFFFNIFIYSQRFFK